MNVITIIALLSIVLMGLSANYFFRTAKVLSIIINAERIHTLDFQLGIEEFYKYLQTGDTVHIEACFESIDRANKMAGTFGRSEILAQTKSNREFSEILFDAVGVAMDDDFSNARLMVNRVKLLLAMNNKELKESVYLAALGAEKGERIKEIISDYAVSPTNAEMEELKIAIDDIHDYYERFATSISQINQFANSLLIWGIILITFILGAITVLLSISISRIISGSVFLLVDNFKEMVKGNIDEDIQVTSHDELGILAGSFDTMQRGLREVVDKMQKIVDGDYEVSLEPKSDQDRLSMALNKMTLALRDTSTENIAQNWVKSGQNTLNEKMRGDKDLQELTTEVITFLAEYLQAQVGTIYLLDDEGKSLNLFGSYAFTKRKKLNESFEMGEGLVGQAAFGRQTISLTQLPDDYTRITSSTGDMIPHNVVVQPLIYNKNLIGVIELASKDVLDDNMLDFIKLVSENIAISINSSRSRDKLNELLQQTQQQAEELQTQQEELRVSNEELEEQTKALKESERELQAQQEELRVTNEELEEKTHSLETQKREIGAKNLDLMDLKDSLEQKAEELEITGKYKSEFLANMSHELRTPLNSLLILSKNLGQNKKGNLTEDQLESVEIIRKSGNDLLNLINEILDLSKIESGKMSINIEKIRFADIANNVQRNFGHMIEEKGLDLIVNVSPDMPDVIETDIIRIEQVIKNLVSNAIKFTTQGSISVDFNPAPSNHRYHRTDIVPSDFFALSVSDTGIGIPQEKQLVIFEAFQQANGSTSRNYGGTGLGLSISKEIAKIFGGEIQLVSEAGQGSTFTLFLPYKYGSKSIETRRKPSPPIQHQKPAFPGNPLSGIQSQKVVESQIKSIDDDRGSLDRDDKVILVVEDDMNFAQVLRVQCHDKGFKFLHAATGESGLVSAEKFLPDAIILDIKLPGMDGIAVLDRIKDNPKIRHIPVHVMSALEETIDVFKKGAIGYLTKPINNDQMDEAFNKLEDMIDRKVKDLLIIEDEDAMRLQIIEIIGHEDVEPVGAASAGEALELLNKKKFDCIVMDLGLPDMSGFELLKRINENKNIEVPPVIIYTGKELTREENNELKKYAESIIIKGIKSDERLLDETALFLHRVVDHLPKRKQDIISTLHDKDAVFRGKKVLLVDDDMRNVFALSKVLDEKGMEIVEAENGKVAIDKLEKDGNIDIVLMDIMMPVMDGYEAMRQIRNKPEFKSLPIIALTAKAMKDDHEKCIASGASDYLTKPIDIEKLVSLMNVWLYR
nr:response regulator [Bacteroidota bacterium]